MMIAARNAFLMGAKLPYNAEIEYIELTGTQWVDSGLTSVSSVLRVAFDATTLVNDGCWMFGGRYQHNYKNFSMCTQISSSGQRIGVQAAAYNGWGDYAKISVPFGRHIFDLNRNQLYIDTVLKKTFNATSWEYTVPLLIGSLNSNGKVATNPFKGRIHGCGIYLDDVLVRDFIPVRVGSGSSAVGFFYDRANPTGGPLGNGLYGNSGTGAFVIGPDK